MLKKDTLLILLLCNIVLLTGIPTLTIAAAASMSHAQDQQAYSCCTTLHQATQQAHTRCMQYFIAQGVNINQCEPHTFNTPLHYAAQHNFDPRITQSVITLLVAAKANLNVENFMSYSPCHIAVICNNADTLALLLDAGANGAAKTRYDDTPLDFAVYHRYVECIKVLIIRGFTASKYPDIVENYTWEPEIRLQTAEYERLRAYLAAQKERRDLLAPITGGKNIAIFLAQREMQGRRK
jgi:hypothetical protein